VSKIFSLARVPLVLGHASPYEKELFIGLILLIFSRQITKNQAKSAWIRHAERAECPLFP
jgi:hypothetical protein